MSLTPYPVIEALGISAPLWWWILSGMIGLLR